MKCAKCGLTISPERLEVLPDTKLCVTCSEEQPISKRGFMVFSHKTAPELVFVDPKDSEAIRRAERADRRSR